MSVFWKKYEVTKERREWTPLRVKAAARAVQREADAMPLFPELRRVTTVDQRMEQMDTRSDAIATRLRAGRAAMWREARKFIRSLSDEDKARLLEKWNSEFMPGDPANIFALARMMGIAVK